MRLPFWVPKSISLLSFGPNLVASEGATWRRQRKVIAPTFTEPNYHLVWQESIIQTQAMLQSWLDDQETGSRILKTLQEDVIRVSFHVINRAGFGVQLSWPSSKMDKDKAGRSTSRSIFAGGTVSDEVMPGHRMSYKDALLTASANLRAFFILPKWFLSMDCFFKDIINILTISRDRSISFHQKTLVVVSPFRSGCNAFSIRLPFTI